MKLICKKGAAGKPCDRIKKCGSVFKWMPNATNNTSVSPECSFLLSCKNLLILDEAVHLSAVLKFYCMMRYLNVIAFSCFHVLNTNSYGVHVCGLHKMQDAVGN